MTKVGLIGCGYWGKNHLRTLRDIGEGILKTVCDLNRPSNFPTSINFTQNYNDLLNDSEINGVILATPTATHYRLAEQFLLHGKNVLVEKPITTNSAEAKSLANLADERRLVLMVGETFRYNSAVRFAKNMVDKGEIGDLRYMESRRVGLGPIRADVSALWDLATHDIYLASMFANKSPDCVSYQGVSHNGHLDDIVSLNLKFTNPDVLATIYVNWEHPVKERKIIVGGKKKSILIDDVQPSEKIVVYERGVDYQPKEGGFGEFIGSTRDGEIRIPKLKINQPLEEELRHFMRCIAGETKCESDGLVGLQTVSVLEAAEKSKELDGKEVKIHE